MRNVILNNLSFYYFSKSCTCGFHKCNLYLNPDYKKGEKFN